MLPSMFNLEHRLAELRQVGEDLRLESQMRGSAEQAGHTTRAREAARAWLVGGPAASTASQAHTRPLATR